MASLAVLTQSSLLRAALTALLSTMGFAPVEEAAELEVLKRRVSDGRRPEMLLLNLTQSDDTLGAAIKEIKLWAPNAKVVCLAPTLDVPRLSACFAAGASGYLLEDISADGLLHSLRLVNSGENVFPSALASALYSAAKLGGHVDTADELSSLHATDLEIDILRCIATGENNRDIGKKLGISESEVSVHIKYILRKLRVSNRTQAALWAVARGLATPLSALARLAGNADGEEARPSRKHHPASSQH